MTSPTPSSGSQSNSDTEPAGAFVKCATCSISVATSSSRTLPCFHAFCRPCHEKLQSSGAGGAYVSCPACLSAAATGGSVVTGICRGCCRSDTAVVELVAKGVTCDYPICASCERSHREMAYFSRHHVVALTPPPPPLPASSLAVGGPARPAPGVDVSTTRSTGGCPVHSGDPLSFFCHQCNAAMCRHCCMLDDPTHRRSLLNPSTPELTTRLNGAADLGGLSYLEKIAETKATQLKVASKNVENAVVFQQEQHQMARDAVNDAYSVFLKALDDRRAEVLRELNVIFTEKQVMVCCATSCSAAYIELGCGTEALYNIGSGSWVAWAYLSINQSIKSVNVIF